VAVYDALVVIYNAPFDAGFLRYELDAAAEVRCAMREFAAVYGEWSHRHGGSRWHRRLLSSLLIHVPEPG
jgi:hypothetical protein